MCQTLAKSGAVRAEAPKKQKASHRVRECGEPTRGAAGGGQRWQEAGGGLAGPDTASTPPTAGTPDLAELTNVRDRASGGDRGTWGGRSATHTLWRRRVAMWLAPGVMPNTWLSGSVRSPRFRHRIRAVQPMTGGTTGHACRAGAVPRTAGQMPWGLVRGGWSVEAGLWRLVCGVWSVWAVWGLGCPSRAPALKSTSIGLCTRAWFYAPPR